MTPAEINFYREISTEILWNLTGRRLGPSCPIVLRPCKKSCVGEGPWIYSGGAFYGSPWIPYIDGGGVWRNASVCGCQTECHCGDELQEIRLDGPVYDIESVQVGTTTLPDTAYRVDYVGGGRGHVLVRTDGGTWPTCQDMAAPVGSADTFAITYRTGVQWPEGLTLAHSLLFCHLARGCRGQGACSCKLPANMTRMSRQGVTQEFLDRTDLQAQGLTGLPVVDQFILSVNPYRQASPSRVYSPDIYRRGQRFTYETRPGMGV
jgi:hypothetical protein